MAQRRRKRIGRVRGRCAAQVEYRHNHVLHLLLGRGTRSNDRLLDFSRRVFKNLDTVLKRGTDRRRARMAKLERTASVLVHEDTFDDDEIWPKLINDPADRFKNLPKPVCKSTVGALDGAAGHVGRTVAAKVNYAEAGQT